MDSIMCSERKQNGGAIKNGALKLFHAELGVMKEKRGL